MSRRFDVIVVGVGGMGSAAAYHLARRGQRVLGLERFDIPHAFGSSHGVTRIIRLAYYEHSAYVPLLRRAYELWRELEALAGEPLLTITGSIDSSGRDRAVFQGSLRACELHDIPHEVLTGAEVNARFPGFRLPPEHGAVWQPNGGFLASERCIVAHVLAAQSAGAEIHARERVRTWEVAASGVKVITDRDTYEADRLVITAGAWNADLAPALSGLARPERQVLAWFQPIIPALFQPATFPVFNLTVDEGRFYGIPVYGIPGFKVGRYHHRHELVDPETMERKPGHDDESLLRHFAERYIPDAAGPTMALATCLFTNTPDEHFIIDTYPGSPQVLIISACSGHGFKFCSVIGEIAADLTIRDSTTHDISLFQLARFQRDLLVGQDSNQ